MEEINQQIIQQSQNREKDAFCILVKQYQQMIFSLALKMICDEAEAKDIVQETFIKAWINIQQYDKHYSFATWLYTITTHLCLDRIKTIKRTQIIPIDKEMFNNYISKISNQYDLENKEWISIVYTLTEQLSDKQKLVFTLCQLEGLSVTETQTITGMNTIQIKSNLYAARQNIKKQLKKLGYE